MHKPLFTPLFALPSILYACIKSRDFVDYLEHREDVKLSLQGMIETASIRLVVSARANCFEDSTPPASC